MDTVKLRLQQLQERSEEERRAQFNTSWFFMAALLIALGLIFRQRGLFVLAACLLTVIPIAWVWRGRLLRHVEYERALDRRCIFPGETVELTARVTNRKLLPLTWLEVKDEVPLALPLEEGALIPTYDPQIGTIDRVLSLRWYERVAKQYGLRGTARGVYRLGPVHMASGDLFALFEAENTRPCYDHLVVYPAIWPLEELGMPSQDPFGERKADRRLLEDPLRTAGIRDYHPEDSLRYIHWKATARRGELQVRVFEPTAVPSLVIFLNVATFEHHWHGVLPELLENAVSVAGSIATWAVGQRYKVGLVANGCRRFSDQPVRVPPGRSPEQLAAMLEALAGVTSFASASIDELLRHESPRLPWGATFVVVTPIVTEALVLGMTRLRDAGRRLALLSLAEEPPPQLERIITHHLPSSSLAFRRRGRASEALRAAGLSTMPSPEAPGGPR